MFKSLAIGAAVGLTAAGLSLTMPAPQANAAWCPGSVNSGSFRLWVIFSEIVVEFCDWAPPVEGIDSHQHCEYGGYIGYGGRCDWRNAANVIVPPPPGYY